MSKQPPRRRSSISHHIPVGAILRLPLAYGGRVEIRVIRRRRKKAYECGGKVYATWTDLMEQVLGHEPRGHADRWTGLGIEWLL